MKQGFRDTRLPGEHVVHLEHEGGAVRLPFGPDGILWNPSPEQWATMTSSTLRLMRFAPVAEEVQAKQPAPEPVAEAAQPEPPKQEDFVRPRRRRQADVPTDPERTPEDEQ